MSLNLFFSKIMSLKTGVREEHVIEFFLFKDHVLENWYQSRLRHQIFLVDLKDHVLENWCQSRQCH
jgi:hypothetical protein